MSKILILKTNNQIEVKDYPTSPVKQSLETLQSAVNGYVEFLDFSRIGLTMVVNEEGKINNLPLNKVATSFFYREYGVDDFIVGDVAFISSTINTIGDPVGLTDQQVADLKTDIQWRLDEANQATEDISNYYATLKGE